MRAEWFTLAELAELKLSGAPRTKRGICVLADREGWAAIHTAAGQPLARRRKGRGGGLEYHFSLLPLQARSALLARGVREQAAEAAAKAGAPDRAAAWAHFDTLNDKGRERAKFSVLTLDAVLQMERGGTARSTAVQIVAAERGVSAGSIWGWFRQVAGKERHDWMAWLAPRYCREQRRTADISPQAWDVFLADYLRQSRPGIAECWNRLKDAAAVHGWTLPAAPATLKRKLDREIDPEVVILKRHGADHLDAIRPAQRRDRSDLRALQAINYDGHKLDLFVEWPDGEVARALLLTFQDLSSNKILAWRLDTSESANGFRLTFGDVIENWGIPDTVFSDNTMAAAAKSNTGGVKYRNRYKIRDDDFLGLFPALGIDLRFTKPAHGQSKPIERAFGDLARYISKAPEFEGAYTGNSPANKPANYGSRTARMIDVLRVCEREIYRYNTRTDRNSMVARGRSFDEVFAESYERDLIRKPDADDAMTRLLWLLPVAGITCRKPDGVIHLYGNRYYSQALIPHIGEKVAVRYDPDRLGNPIHVYDLAGDYIAAADCIADSGFMDVGEAKKHARAKSQKNRATREMAEAQVVLNERDVARLMPDAPASTKPEARVIQPQRFRPDAPVRAQRGLPERDSNALPDELVNNVLAMTAARNRNRL